MPGSLAGASLAAIGGDLRQLAVAREFARQGARVRTYALPESPDLHACAALRDALDGAAVVILPITGVAPDGRVVTMSAQPEVWLDDEFWASLAAGALVATGSLPPDLKARAAAGGYRILEYAENDEIAILNSIPTAEGALQLAMEGLPITIHGSRTIVLGLGRVGLTVARLFKAVGAEVWVAADRAALRARAVELGCRALILADLPRIIGEADLIINTIPAPVLPERLVAMTKPSVYIIDLASAPGGVDFQAAGALARRAVLALGLPGKVAPESAGRILASTLPAIIQQELG